VVIWAASQGVAQGAAAGTEITGIVIRGVWKIPIMFPGIIGRFDLAQQLPAPADADSPEMFIPLRIPGILSAYELLTPLYSPGGTDDPEIRIPVLVPGTIQDYDVVIQFLNPL
jgi:hypothetical protein